MLLLCEEPLVLLLEPSPVLLLREGPSVLLLKPSPVLLLREEPSVLLLGPSVLDHRRVDLSDPLELLFELLRDVDILLLLLLHSFNPTATTRRLRQRARLE